MEALKGFAIIPNLIDNTTDTINIFGELSTHSRTYSMDQTAHKNDVYRDVNFVCFSHKDEVGARIDTPRVVTDHIIRLVSWVYGKSANGDITSDAYLFRSYFLAEFESIIGEFYPGRMVTDGVRWLPEYMEWRTNLNGIDYILKIWLSDEAFQEQYDEYEILVIPPTREIFELTETYTKLKPKVDAYTKQAFQDHVDEVTNEHPPTKVRVETFEWFDTYDLTLSLMTDWGAAIYGKAGDNMDAVKNAMREYVLLNSTELRDYWITKLPDLFKNYEFIFIPQWENYAIPQEGEFKGIYSSLLRISEEISKAHIVCEDYDTTHVRNTITTFPSTYQHIGMSVVGSPENKNNDYEFELKYPDYIPVSTQIIDFARMSDRTQQFARLLSNGVMYAETLDKFSRIPKEYNKVTRGDFLYLSFSYNKVQYLILSKKSYLESPDLQALLGIVD